MKRLLYWVWNRLGLPRYSRFPLAGPGPETFFRRFERVNGRLALVNYYGCLPGRTEEGK